MGFKPMKKHGQDGRATLLDTKFRTAPAEAGGKPVRQPFSAVADSMLVGTKRFP
jgi:hypothetical protein